jgi:CRISPR-associated protein Csm1
MSVQVFLQARITGIERFLADAADDLETRAHWATLLVEVLPRALLAELGLAPVLLGYSGGEHFFVVIPGEFRPRAEEFLTRAAAALRERDGRLRLVWASTENLGDWSDVRRRLNEEMRGKAAAVAPRATAETWEPFAPPAAPAPLFELSGSGTPRDATSVGWSPEQPDTIRIPNGRHTWPLGSRPDDIQFPQHAALDDAGSSPAGPALLASRAEGRKTWGVLRGDIDGSEIQLRRAQTIDEYLRLLIMYKQFFAGELPMLCSMPEFFRKTTLLRAGGEDFAIYGAWDALIAFAREMQRLFLRFVDANLRDLAGSEGKTISMGLALAGEQNSTLGAVYRTAGVHLELAKSAGNDSIHLLGRTLEWKQLGDAADTKGSLTRMVSEFGCSPQLLYEIASFYRGGATRGRAPALTALNSRVSSRSTVSGSIGPAATTLVACPT